MRGLQKRRTLQLSIGVLLTVASVSVRAETFYVAPNGDDNTNTGAENSPFASMAKAQATVHPGDTVYFRTGRYVFASATASNGVDLTTSGAPGQRINYWAYPGETPVFDFSGMTAAVRIKGINVTASYIHLKGLEIENVPQNLTTEHESWGIYNNGGSNNVYELLNLHHNMGPGLFIVRGSDNLVLNCDSHHNYDPKSSTGPGTNADGFGCHVNQAGNTGNVFRGCRAWWNSDDGYDLIQAQEAVVIENSWAWYNGYLPDSTTTASGGDGNGFKAGGYGVPATKVPPVPPAHVVRFSVAFRNRASGFYQNHHPVSNRFENDTALDNRSSDFNLLGLSGTVGIVTNSVAFGGTLVANGPGADDAFNSWTLPVTVSVADFVSVDFTGVDGPRQADGSLPNLSFVRLAPGSDLIDRGRDLGFPFNGVAPDLGAFESGPPLGSGGATGSTGGTPGDGGAIATGGFGGGSGGVTSSGGAGIGGNGGAIIFGAGATMGLGGGDSTGSGGALIGGSGAATGTGGVSMGPAGNGGASGSGYGASPGASAGAAATNGATDSSDDSTGSAGSCSCRAASGRRDVSFVGWLILSIAASLFRRRHSRRDALSER